MSERRSLPSWRHTLADIERRAISLLDEKREDAGDRRSQARWSMTRWVVLALITAEVYRLFTLKTALNWPEAIFASSLAYALPMTWLLYHTKIGDIPRVVESFFSIFRRQSDGYGFGGWSQDSFGASVRPPDPGGPIEGDDW